MSDVRTSDARCYELCRVSDNLYVPQPIVAAAPPTALKRLGQLELSQGGCCSAWAPVPRTTQAFNQRKT
eukprot:6209980-Pleurochrysis_carterae.AAC.2